MTASVLGLFFFVWKFHGTGTLNLTTPILILRVMMGLVLTVLYIPIVAVLLTPFTCSDPQLEENSPLVNSAVFQCGSATNVVYSVVSGLVLIPLLPVAIVTALLLFETNPRAKNKLARSSSRADMWYIILRTVMTVMFVFRADIALRIYLLTMGTLVIFARLLIVQPYFRAEVNNLLVSLMLMASYVSLCAVVAFELDNPTIHTSSILLFAGTPIIGAVGILLSVWRRRSIKARARAIISNNVTHVDDVAKHMANTMLSEPELAKGPHQGSGVSTGTVGDSTVHPHKGTIGQIKGQESVYSIGSSNSHARKAAWVLTDNDAKLKHYDSQSALTRAARVLLDDPTRSNLEDALKLYQVGLADFPKSASVHVAYAFFIISFRKEFSVGIPIIHRAKKLSRALDIRFAIYRVEREFAVHTASRNLGDNRLDTMSHVEYQQLFKVARTYHEAAISQIRLFWSSLLAHPPQLNALPKIAKTLEMYEKRSKAAYLQLMDRFPNSHNLCRAFGRFLEDVLQDRHGAEEFYRKAELLERDEHVADTQSSSFVGSQNSSTGKGRSSRYHRQLQNNTKSTLIKSLVVKLKIVLIVVLAMITVSFALGMLSLSKSSSTSYHIRQAGSREVAGYSTMDSIRTYQQSVTSNSPALLQNTTRSDLLSAASLFRTLHKSLYFATGRSRSSRELYEKLQWPIREVQQTDPVTGQFTWKTTLLSFWDAGSRYTLNAARFAAESTSDITFLGSRLNPYLRFVLDNGQAPIPEACAQAVTLLSESADSNNNTAMIFEYAWSVVLLCLILWLVLFLLTPALRRIHYEKLDAVKLFMIMPRRVIRGLQRKYRGLEADYNDEFDSDIDSLLSLDQDSSSIDHSELNAMLPAEMADELLHEHKGHHHRGHEADRTADLPNQPSVAPEQPKLSSDTTGGGPETEVEVVKAATSVLGTSQNSQSRLFGSGDLNASVRDRETSIVPDSALAPPGQVHSLSSTNLILAQQQMESPDLGKSVPDSPLTPIKKMDTTRKISTTSLASPAEVEPRSRRASLSRAELAASSAGASPRGGVAPTSRDRKASDLVSARKHLESYLENLPHAEDSPVVVIDSNTRSFDSPQLLGSVASEKSLGNARTRSPISLKRISQDSIPRHKLRFASPHKRQDSLASNQPARHLSKPSTSTQATNLEHVKNQKLESDDLIGSRVFQQGAQVTSKWTLRMLILQFVATIFLISSLVLTQVITKQVYLGEQDSNRASLIFSSHRAALTQKLRFQIREAVIADGLTASREVMREHAKVTLDSLNAIHHAIQRSGDTSKNLVAANNRIREHDYLWFEEPICVDTTGTPCVLSPENTLLTQTLNDVFISYVTHADFVLASEPSTLTTTMPSYQFLSNAHHLLSEKLDQSTAIFSKHIQERISQQRVALSLVYVANVVGLILIYGFILRPMTFRLEQEASQTTRLAVMLPEECFIRPLIEWSATLYSCSVMRYDVQHMKLILIINRLHLGMIERRGHEIIREVLKELIDYTVTHFSDEEEMFKKYQYEAMEEHMEKHALLVQEVLQFQKNLLKTSSSVNFELMLFLKRWLIHHIHGDDRKYAPYMLSHGMEGSAGNEQILMDMFLKKDDQAIAQHT
eukprot:TRINITY_DN222_c0_g1_i3.p1 TRINITY_DN222_c0_g1~~TRINITY_DN222_c0_g1_i3.p1  ORF type:complete len:1609 (-),score=170.96 TRINITY_DN222_c0_g1_i3:42-4868(-)